MNAKKVLSDTNNKIFYLSCAKVLFYEDKYKSLEALFSKEDRLVFIIQNIRLLDF